MFYLYIGANLGAKNSTVTLSKTPKGGPNHKGRGGLCALERVIVPTHFYVS